MAGIVSPRPAPDSPSPGGMEKGRHTGVRYDNAGTDEVPGSIRLRPSKKPRHDSAAFSVARKLRKRTARLRQTATASLSQALRPVTGRQYGAALGPFPIALQFVRLRA